MVMEQIIQKVAQKYWFHKKVQYKQLVLKSIDPNKIEKKVHLGLWQMISMFQTKTSFCFT